MSGILSIAEEGTARRVALCALPAAIAIVLGLVCFAGAAAAQGTVPAAQSEIAAELQDAARTESGPEDFDDLGEENLPPAVAAPVPLDEKGASATVRKAVKKAEEFARQKTNQTADQAKDQVPVSPEKVAIEKTGEEILSEETAPEKNLSDENTGDAKPPAEVVETEAGEDVAEAPPEEIADEIPRENAEDLAEEPLPQDPVVEVTDADLIEAADHEGEAAGDEFTGDEASGDEVSYESATEATDAAPETGRAEDAAETQENEDEGKEDKRTRHRWWGRPY